jgi:hypothetical protein
MSQVQRTVNHCDICNHEWIPTPGVASVWPRGLEHVAKRPSKAVRDFEYESRKKFLRERKASTTEVTHEV